MSRCIAWRCGNAATRRGTRFVHHSTQYCVSGKQAGGRSLHRLSCQPFGSYAVATPPVSSGTAINCDRARCCRRCNPPSPNAAMHTFLLKSHVLCCVLLRAVCHRTADPSVDAKCMLAGCFCTFRHTHRGSLTIMQAVPHMAGFFGDLLTAMQIAVDTTAWQDSCSTVNQAQQNGTADMRQCKNSNHRARCHALAHSQDRNCGSACSASSAARDDKVEMCCLMCVIG